MTQLRQIMLEELRRRNYAESTIHAYIHTVEHFSRHFHRSPDQLGPEHRNAAVGSLALLLCTGVKARRRQPHSPGGKAQK